MIKKSVIFSIIFGTAILAHSPAQAGQLQSFLKCRKIIKNERRLVCFDTAAQKSRITQKSNIRQKSFLPSSDKAGKINNFGKEQLQNSPVKQVRQDQKKTVREELKTIRLKVIKHLYTNSEKFVLFMKNGQIWKQKDEGWIHLPKGEFEVKIAKGIFGSYNMIVPTRIAIIKVKRLK